MTKTSAVKMIMSKIYFGGLPRAIEIYNYISCFGEIEVTSDMIKNYFNK